MKSCLFCNTDLCTCTGKIYDRYLYLESYAIELKAFRNKNNLGGTELQAWFLMYDQAKEEIRKIKLLITFNPYEKPKKKSRLIRKNKATGLF